MKKIILNYISEDGDFSKTFLECHDTYEGYNFLVKKLYLSDPDAAPIISDLSLLINHFIKLDIYDEWQVARVIAKKVIQMLEDGTKVMNQDGTEAIHYISLSLLYIRSDLSGANKKELLKSNELGNLETNVINIWNHLEGSAKTMKDEKAINDKNKRDTVDANVKK